MKKIAWAHGCSENLKRENAIIIYNYSETIKWSWYKNWYEQPNVNPSIVCMLVRMRSVQSQLFDEIKLIKQDPAKMIPYPTLSTPVTGESKLTYMYVRLHQEYKCLKPDWACENAEGCSIHRVRQLDLLPPLPHRPRVNLLTPRFTASGLRAPAPPRTGCTGSPRPSWTRA